MSFEALPQICINFEFFSGLVGKSTFLDLKLENEGAQFLGEWFGEGKVDIALQVTLLRYSL